MFLNNKYTQTYYRIIQRAQNRLKPLEYTEKHHIIPKCKPFCGPNTKENLVNLTFKEHWICHHLLMKMIIDSFGRYKMYYAFHRMGFNSKTQKRIINFKMFERIKNANRNLCSGKNSILFGKKVLESTKQKIAKATKAAMQRPEVKQKVSDGLKKRFKEHPESHGMKNKKHKSESIQQMSESHSNMSQETKDKIGQTSHIMWENPEIRAKLLVHIQNPLEETRKKMRDKKLGKSSWNKNIPCREETKNKIGLANTGKICKEETKKKLRESCGKKLAKDYIFLDPNGIKIEIHNLSKYCRENNLNQGLMSAVSLGKRKQHRGYKQYIPV